MLFAVAMAIGDTESAKAAEGENKSTVSGTSVDDGASVDDTGFVRVERRESVRFVLAPGSESIAERFQLGEHEFPAAVKRWRTWTAVRAYRVTFPSPVTTEIPENNVVHAEYFQPRGPGPHPGVVVLHILGGDFNLSRLIAYHLAANGTAALFVKMPYYGERRSPTNPRRMIERDPRLTVEGMTQGVLDIRRAAAWLGQRPEVDSNRLGITGISLGGIMTALAATAEPRFKSVAIYLGGGGLAEAIWDSPVRETRGVREQWEATGGTRETFLETLRLVDPAAYASNLRGRRILIVSAANDEVIPPEASRRLHAAIGDAPKIVWLNSGHYSAAFYLPRELVRLDTFFADKQGVNPIARPVDD
jgi:dienelactone hydrolase